MNLISDILFWISNGLLVPVVVLLAVVDVVPSALVVPVESVLDLPAAVVSIVLLFTE